MFRKYGEIAAEVIWEDWDRRSPEKDPKISREMIARCFNCKVNEFEECKAAKTNGISVLNDDIAADNPSYKLFLKNGFEIEYQNEEVVMVKRDL